MLPFYLNQGRGRRSAGSNRCPSSTVLYADDAHHDVPMPAPWSWDLRAHDFLPAALPQAARRVTLQFLLSS